MPGLYVTASAMYACAIPWVEASCTVLLSNAGVEATVSIFLRYLFRLYAFVLITLTLNPGQTQNPSPGRQFIPVQG
uniref:Uncharacterized protein n=1 Tax=Timema poppense TaxID=170557 RepID=A0A7R9DJR3_TIMPO|nr:unnamed protein product [Timema poppensis]